MENDKKYTQVNNPTQINIGSTENSLQTAGRNVREAFGKPKETLNSTVDVLDDIANGLAAGVINWVKVAIIPLVVCTFLFLWFIATIAHTTIWEFLFGASGLFWMLGQVAIMLFQTFFLKDGMGVFWAFIFCAVLFYTWTTVALMMRVFGNDRKRVKKAVKLSLLASLYMILSRKK